MNPQRRGWLDAPCARCGERVYRGFGWVRGDGPHNACVNNVHCSMEGPALWDVCTSCGYRTFVMRKEDVLLQPGGGAP